MFDGRCNRCGRRRERSQLRMALRAQGAHAAAVVSAIDRSEEAGGPLTDVDIETRAVLTRDQLAAY